MEALMPHWALHLYSAEIDHVYSKLLLVVNPVCNLLQGGKSLRLQSAEQVAYQKRHKEESYKKLSCAVTNI